MDENMFKRLLFAGEEDEGFSELVALGYFKKVEGTYCRTGRYQEDTEEYINSKKKMLYKAVQKLGSADDIGKIMERTGIKDYVTFVFLAEELIQEGKIIKDSQNRWIPALETAPGR